MRQTYAARQTTRAGTKQIMKIPERDECVGRPATHGTRSGGVAFVEDKPASKTSQVQRQGG